MDFVDNMLNPKTGTIRGRAIFDNKDGLLTPGYLRPASPVRRRARGVARAGQRDCIGSGQQDRLYGRRRRHGRHQTGRARPDGGWIARHSLRPCADRSHRHRGSAAGPSGAEGHGRGRQDRSLRRSRTSNASRAFNRQRGVAMRFSHFFIDRPIFAGVISILLTLVGAISFRALPITEYPEIAPPTVVVNATYAGASAEVIAADGRGADRAGDQRRRQHALCGVAIDRQRRVVDQRRVQAGNQHRPGAGAGAEPRLDRAAAAAGRGAAHRRDRAQELARPDAGHPSGLAGRQPWTSNTSPTTRRSTSRTSSPASTAWATPSCSARATIPCGSGSTRPRCSRAGSRPATWSAPCGPPMCRWRPVPSTSRRRRRRAGSRSRCRRSAGCRARINSATSLSLPIEDGRVTRVRDIARVELGAQDYTTNAYLDNQVATAIGIFQRPGSNALATAASRARDDGGARQEFPAGTEPIVSPTTPPSSFSNRSTR